MELHCSIGVELDHIIPAHCNCVADALLGPWSSRGGDAAHDARPDSLRQSVLRWLQQCYRLADSETGFCGRQAGHSTRSHPAGLLRVNLPLVLLPSPLALSINFCCWWSSLVTLFQKITTKIFFFLNTLIHTARHKMASTHSCVFATFKHLRSWMKSC